MRGWCAACSMRQKERVQRHSHWKAEGEALSEVKGHATGRPELPSEQQLIRAAKAGDSLAFNRLVRQHQDHLYRLMVRACHHPQDAEEVASEAFVRAYERLQQFEGRSSFISWLGRIATHLCFRRRERGAARGLADRAGSRRGRPAGSNAGQRRPDTRTAGDPGRDATADPPCHRRARRTRSDGAALAGHRGSLDGRGQRAHGADRRRSEGKAPSRPGPPARAPQRLLSRRRGVALPRRAARGARRQVRATPPSAWHLALERSD